MKTQLQGTLSVEPGREKEVLAAVAQAMRERNIDVSDDFDTRFSFTVLPLRRAKRWERTDAFACVSAGEFESGPGSIRYVVFYGRETGLELIFVPFAFLIGWALGGSLLSGLWFGLSCVILALLNALTIPLGIRFFVRRSARDSARTQIASSGQELSKPNSSLTSG
jgi:hypothetical protein